MVSPIRPGQRRTIKARVGIGYDIHRLASQRRLVLGGVVIPHRLGLAGHSDADVLTHAVMDALLGAAGLGDIGTHFPNTDSRYRDVSSLELLKQVVCKCRASNLGPANVDVTVIAQRPPLQPHIPQMRANLAQVLGLPEGAVSVKATTNEGLGPVGRQKAIAAYAVCLLEPLRPRPKTKASRR